MQVRMAKLEQDIAELKEDMKVVKECLIGADMRAGLVAEHQIMKQKVVTLEKNQNKILCAIVSVCIGVAIGLVTGKF